MSLFKCDDLVHLDLARNGFTNIISPLIGSLSKLQSIRLNENRLEGSIPTKMFDISVIQELMLNSNRLTGSIPTEIGSLSNASVILLSHNSLKGTIPEELTGLTNLVNLHVHHNQLTGIAPEVVFRNKEQNNFIADCAAPSLLPRPLECTTCTMCCNSEDICQNKNYWAIPVWLLTIIWTVIFPIFLTCLAFVIIKTRRHICHVVLKDNRDPLTIYSDDSVYCLILSSDPIGWIIYAVTLATQVVLYITFLQASSDVDKDSDYKFTYYCTANSIDCQDKNAVGLTGRLIFFIVTIVFLSDDFLKGYLQIKRSLIIKDTQILFSGLALLSLSSLALVTSFLYNDSSGVKNTDIIKDSMVLLFFSDLDEQLMTFLVTCCPLWIEKKQNEIKALMAIKFRTYTERLDSNILIERYGIERSDLTGQRIILDTAEYSMDMGSSEPQSDLESSERGNIMDSSEYSMVNETSDMAIGLVLSVNSTSGLSTDMKTSDLETDLLLSEHNGAMNTSKRTLKHQNPVGTSEHSMDIETSELKTGMKSSDRTSAVGTSEDNMDIETSDKKTDLDSSKRENVVDRLEYSIDNETAEKTSTHDVSERENTTEEFEFSA